MVLRFKKTACLTIWTRAVMSFLQKLFGRPQESELSLHGEMYRLDIVEELLRDAVRGYQTLIDLIVAHVPKAARDIGIEHKKKLKQIRNLLDSTPSKPLIGEVRLQLERTIASFTRELDLQLDQQEKETKQVIAIIAVMAESMAGREKQYNVRFRGIGKKLRVLTTSNDIAEIRRKLEAEVIQLEKYVEEMARDTDLAVSRVQMELHQARKEPAVVAKQSPEDETGNAAANITKAALLAGRRETEQSIEARHRLDRRFCAARFCIDNMPAVAAQFGLPAAAELMQQVGEVIGQRFDVADLIGRWSDSDLVVITNVPLPEVAMRVSDLEISIAGPYVSGTREVKLSVRTCVIERLSGERGDETIGRIESMLVPVGRR